MADDVGADPDWDPTPDPAWSAKVLKASGGWTQSGSKHVLQGPCPRCGHKGAISAWVTDVIFGVAAQAAESKSEPVECKCGYAHKNAPKDVLGCGAFGRVELTK